MTEFIETQKNAHSVAVMCRALDMPQSQVYDKRKALPCARKQDDARLAKVIYAEFIRHRKTYGSPRITQVLREQDERVSQKRVARLMREKGLDARPKPKFVCTTHSKHQRGYAPNLLKRHFTTDAPNKVWVSDITYVPTHEGWLYLATVLDLFSRRIVGYALSKHIDDALVLEALKRALALRTPTQGLIHHSDRGSQYASRDYRALLGEHGFTQSMSRKADCYDNAVAESVFATIEKDVLLRNRFPTRSQARHTLIDYIENFYNPIRKHSYNNYQSPIQAERQHQQLSIAA